MGNLYKSEIVKFGKLIYERNLNAAYGGNISVRDGDKIYITPSGFNKAFLTEDDILVTDISGNILEPPVNPVKPSSESKMHYAIYKSRKDVKAIIHAHPSYCVSLAISHKNLENLLPETTIVLGEVGFVPYITPGGSKLGNTVARALTKGDACIMGNHGATVVGNNLFEAFNKLELLESTAKSFVFSLLIGEVKTIPQKDISLFIDMHKKLSL